MAFLGQSYAADDLPQGNSYEPLPDGWYDVNITKAEVKDTKTGGGSYISVGYTVTGPSHEGRVVFGNLNIRNANPKAEEIGRQQLGELMRAIGLVKVEDSDQLIGGSCKVKLKIKRDEQYGDKNEVVAWKANGAAMPSGGITSHGSSDSKPAGNKPPWAK